MTEDRQVVIHDKIGHEIRRGVPGRLAFDEACRRKDMFNEIYVHGVISEILVSNLNMSDAWISSNYAHPSLQDVYNPQRRSGRYREVDIYLQPHRGLTGSSLAMEVKWAGSEHSKWTRILSDLYRLKLIAMDDPSTQCLFVMTGKKTELENRLTQLHTAGRRRALRDQEDRPPLTLLRDRSVKREEPTKDLYTGRGTSRIRIIDDMGKFFGGESTKKLLPLDHQGKHRVPDPIKLKELGHTISGKSKWMTAVWRVT